MPAEGRSSWVCQVQREVSGPRSTRQPPQSSTRQHHPALPFSHTEPPKFISSARSPYCFIFSAFPHNARSRPACAERATFPTNRQRAWAWPTGLRPVGHAQARCWLFQFHPVELTHVTKRKIQGFKQPKFPNRAGRTKTKSQNPAKPNPPTKSRNQFPCVAPKS